MSSSIVLEERVDTLESILGQYIVHTDTILTRLERSMAAQHVEMKDFKDEMRDFKTESNKKWGELANKMGTLVEDLVGPAFIPMAKRCFGEEINDLAHYLRRRREGLEGEFDIVAASETRVYLVEVKSTIREAHIDRMVQNTLPLFRKLFPEYAEKPIVPILASLQIEASIINRCTKSKVYAMAFREWDYMDILNLEDLQDQL